MIIDDNEILSLIVNEGNDVTYLADMENYTLYFLSRKGCQLLQDIEEDEWYGRPCYEVLQGRTSPCPFCTNKMLREDRFYEWEFDNEVLGKQFVKRGIIVNYKGHKTRMEFATDVTKLKSTQTKLKQELDVEKVLVECALTLNREEKDGADAIERFLKIIRDYYDADRIYIFEMIEKSHSIKNTYECCREGAASQKDSLQAIADVSAKYWMETFEKGQLYQITALDGENNGDSEEYRILAERGISSLLAAPLIIEDKIIGFLGVEEPKRNIDTKLLLRLAPEFIVNNIRKRQIWQAARDSGYSDALTGLGNRKGYHTFSGWLESQNEKRFGIVSIDINNLRAINKAYGHTWGDHMIINVGNVLKECFGEQIYRVGDDEFIAFCFDRDKERFDIDVKELQNRTKWDEQLPIAIGASWFDGESDVDYQVSIATEKMHINKMRNYKRGGGDPKEVQKYRSVLAENLQKEIENKKFIVYLQPKINLKNGRIGGAEALIRRIGEKGNIIFPNSFVSHYENDEIIRYIDFFVLERVCRLQQDWKERGLKRVGIAVNFSRITMMEEDVVEKMKFICRKYSVEPKQITIEVTESIGTLERDALKALLDEIQKAGFRISLDDFGSRYSDLALLSLADFDELKLDKSLIDRLEVGGKPRVIAEYVLRMCMDLESTHSVAEGIESISQKEILKSFGCELGQGYLFDKPITIEAFEKKYIKKES